MHKLISRIVLLVVLTTAILPIDGHISKRVLRIEALRDEICHVSVQSDLAATRRRIWFPIYTASPQGHDLIGRKPSVSRFDIL